MPCANDSKAEMGEIIMDTEELNEILRLHQLWLNAEPGGRRANLYGKNLSQADLSGENLQSANLNWATLIGADLRYADLRGANLTAADLYGADLTGARLRWANLFRVRLYGAKLPQGCRYYDDTPKHDIIIIHDVAHIGCHSLPIAKWLERGPEIGDKNGYTPDQIDFCMEILRREHERERTK
jgi:hypothetical protein